MEYDYRELLYLSKNGEEQFKIIYLDEEYLLIYITSLVVKVQSINAIFGPLFDFLRMYDLYGLTNGHILILGGPIPDICLDRLVEDALAPEGFEVGKDYTTAYLISDDPAQGIYCPNKRLHIIPYVDWLDGKELGPRASLKLIKPKN